MIDRMDRVRKMILREVSEILQSDIGDPRVKHVTVTRVEVTRDLRMAKVYYTLPEDSNKEEVAKGLKSSGSFIRKELAERVSLKYIPHVSFREDREKEREETIDKLFDRIEEELGIEPEGEEGIEDEQR
jgi:ribosome-binding factor A